MLNLCGLDGKGLRTEHGSALFHSRNLWRDKAGKMGLLFLNSESLEILTEQRNSHGDSNVLRSHVLLLDIWTMD